VISIFLPTFNQAAHLPDALKALAAQTRGDFELIACDDGSTDGTFAVLWQYDVRTVTHEKNQGTAAAINSAAALASPDSRYFTWVSSDNMMYPRWLGALAGELDAHPHLGAVYSAYNRYEDRIDRVVLPGDYCHERLLRSDDCYFGPSFLIRREVWQEHRGGISHDYDNWARVEEACWARGLTIGYVGQPLCDYHAHPDRASVRLRHLYDAPKWRDEAIRRRAAN
jgi:glycosyltransferase involved in cell wall biosynthesis